MKFDKTSIKTLSNNIQGKVAKKGKCFKHTYVYLKLCFKLLKILNFDILLLQKLKLEMIIIP